MFPWRNCYDYMFDQMLEMAIKRSLMNVNDNTATQDDYECDLPAEILEYEAWVMEQYKIAVLEKVVIVTGDTPSTSRALTTAEIEALSQCSVILPYTYKSIEKTCNPIEKTPQIPEKALRKIRKSEMEITETTDEKNSPIKKQRIWTKLFDAARNKIGNGSRARRNK